MYGRQWTTRAREYRLPRIERTEIWSSGRQIRLVTTRAPWQLISRVGAISEEGFPGLLSVTNIFSATRCSFRSAICVPATSAPLGRAVQHQHLIAGILGCNSTKGQLPAFYPVPRFASPLARRRETITIRQPGTLAQTVQRGGNFF